MEDVQHQAEALALSSPLLLPYERQLIEEAIQDDCLIITAAGLGWQRVVAVLLRIAQHTRMAGTSSPPPSAKSDQQNPQRQGPLQNDDDSAAGASTDSSAAAGRGNGPPTGHGLPGCVLVLGASPWQRDLITAELARHDRGLLAPVDINNEVPAAERVQLYRAVPGGRPLFITPRILVVDLLARRLRGREVAGVLLLNAHRVSDTSGEGFAVALLRGDSPAGTPGACWVRAVSDLPVSFNQGFNKVEKVMKALHVRRLHLWPRFQEHVRQCLDEHKPVVVEWDQELSGPMLLIQAALLEVLEGLIRELRRTNNKLDTSELVLENGVLRSFDEIVRRQLDPIWHTISWKTRRICADLRTLRELSALLLSTDCVTFLAHLEGLRQSEGVRCVWLFHDATHAIYEQARRRVYIYRQPAAGSTPGTAARGVAAGSSSSSSGGGGAAEVAAVLEEPPKWGLLVEVLREVQRQRREMRALRNLDPAVLAAAAAVGSGSGTCPAGDPDADADALQQRAPSQDTGHDVAAAPSGRRARTSGAMSTAAACVEVVDLASEDDGDEDDAGGRKAADVASCAAAASTSQAVKRPSFGSEAGAAAASADVAAGAQSLLALLKDLGLIGEEGEGTETVGGDGGEGSGRSAGAAPPADGSAASERVAAAGLGLRVTPRDLRLLAEAGSGPVLVVARELHSAKLLERVVREGGRAVMQHQYESYLLNKLQCGEGPRRGGVGGGGAGRGGSGRGGGGGGWKRYRGGIVDGEEGGRGPVLRPGEHQALLAAAHLVGVERGELTAGTGAQGRGAKRAKTSHHREAAAAENDGAGGGARGGRGGRRGGGSGGSQRRRKPDDSPVRVAAAAAAEEKEEEVEEEEEEEEEQDAAGGGPGAFRRVAGRVEGVSGVGGGSGGSRSGSGAIGKHGDGDSGPGDSEDDWVEGAPVRSRQPPSRQQQRRGRGVAGRGRAGKAQQRGQQQRSHGRSRGGDVSSGEAAATGSPTIPGDSGGGTDTLGGRGGGAGSGGPADGANGPSVAPLHSPPPSLLRDVHFVSLDGHDEFVLWRLKPSFVIMYEPDLAFLRQLEVYQAERCLGGGCPVWLHTLSYAQSLEQQRFRAAVERERETLLRLIQAKQHLVLPTQAAPGSSGANGSRSAGSGMSSSGGGGALSADLWLDVYSANALTRVAGGRAAAAPAAVARAGGSGMSPTSPKRLVVDVREFMSSLPAVLHQKGFELLPVTLEVGDYVLSPQLVVERKSLPDLHASLASGRLYHQAEVMCRHYARPLLLIEFDADRQFGLQSPAELGDEIDPKNVISKLTLLTLHFPKLRLIWSRSPHATADLFAVLKSNQEEPDPAAAALVGVPLGPDGAPLPLQPGAVGKGGGGGGTGPGAALETVVNQPALELLRRLPGVNDSNYRAILGHVSSLAELVSLPLERLETIMASAKNARALRDFLDAPCPRI